MAEEKERGHIRYSRIFVLILIAYTVLMLSLSIPRIPWVMKMYRVQEHAELFMHGHDEEMKSFKVVLSTSSSYAESERSIESRGRDDLHLALEALLLDESEEELRNGLVSYIPEGTKLLGVSEEAGYIFIDLSKEMAGADRRAFEEMKRTLALIEDPVDISFMIEGKLINE